MTYYEQLIGKMGKAMAKHPNSTIAMTSDTFEIIGASKDPAKLSAQMSKKLKHGQVPAIFERMPKNQTWIL
jgi:hypothetical protein